MDHVFIIDQPILANFLGWGGPVGSDLRRRGRTLEFRGRMSAPHRTGRLRIGIKSRERVVVDGLQIEVGNFDGPKYAAAQHQGAKPHVITPKGPYNLRFYWVKKQTWVSTRIVHHPGNPATLYLSRHLREAVN